MSWEEYEEWIMREIYTDRDCREALSEAQTILNAWEDDPDIDDLDEDDNEWCDLEDDVDEED